MIRSPSARRGCGGDELAEYAEGRLPPPRAAVWEAHLTQCARCRFDLAELQELRTRLARGGPDVPGGLTSALLALGADPAESAHSADGRAAGRGADGFAGPPRRMPPGPDAASDPGRIASLRGVGTAHDPPRPAPGAGQVPPVPVPAANQRVGGHPMSPLLLVAPTSPPVHRSALRSGVFAVAVASASLAAAWSLGVIAVGGGQVATVPAGDVLPSATPGAGATISLVNWAPSVGAGPEWPCWDDKAQSFP